MIEALRTSARNAVSRRVGAVLPCVWRLSKVGRSLSLVVVVVDGRILSSLALKSVRGAALTEAFTLVGRPVDEDFGGDDVAKREEHLHEFAVTELLGQVVDEQVAALGS